MEVEEDNVQVNIENLKTVIFNAQNQVKSNVYDYDAHVKLLSSLSELYSIYRSLQLQAHDNEQKAGTEQSVTAFKKLRNARKGMATVFPLSVELWKQWIEDELNSPLSVDHNYLEEIFSNATADYLSVDIWCMYMKYLISRHKCGNDNNVTEGFIRENFEKAIVNCGLHYKDGHKIWEQYQKFEQEIVLENKKKVNEDNSPQNIEHFKSSLSNLIKLFRRQMHIPLVKHDELLQRFTDTVNPLVKKSDLFSGETDFFKIEDLENIHESTSNKIEAQLIAVHENYLEEHQHSFEAYQSYITHELDAGLNDPARVQCLYERAIVHHCLKPTLWLDYIDFLNDTLKQSDMALTTCKRALRNVTWDSCIYIKYAVVLEQMFTDKDEIRNVYEMGLEKYSGNGINYSSVWMSYVSFEKRLCESKALLLKKRLHIYELIQRALSQFESLAEPEKFVIEFMTFWINIEKYWFDDESKSEVILKYFGIKYRKSYSVWYQVLILASASGNKSLVNDLYNIGLGEFPDSFEQLCHNWLNFENIFGTLKSYSQVEKKILLHVPSRIQSQKTKESLSVKSKIEHQNKYLIGWLNRAENQLFNDVDRNKSNVSQQKFEESFVSKNRTLSSFDAETSDRYGIGNGGNKRNVSSDKSRNDSTATSGSNAPVIGPVMPPGFCQSNNDHADESDSGSDSETGDDFLMPPPKKVRFTEKKEQIAKLQQSENDEHNRTVYVSNLHPATTDNDLKIIFGRAGNVLKVDVHRQRGGKIFAFVTFSKPEEAQCAFELEHTPIRNRPMYVSKFNRSKDKQASTHHYSQKEERNKLFVTNLDKSTTPNDLEKLFNRHGDMVSLRLINKKGSSKQFAYVEYKTEDDATQYRNQLNNTVVKGRQIIVEFSDPGRGSQSDKQKQFPTSISSSIVHKSGVNEDCNNSIIGNNEIGDKISTDTKSEEKSNDSTSNNISDKASKKPSSSFGFIPLQARNTRNVQPVIRRPKGPAVRINVTPPNKSSSSQDNLSASSEEPKSETSTSKSNDDFRKMLLSNK